MPVISPLKQKLKLSRAITGLSETRQGILRDAQVVAWSLRRTSQIKQYLQTHSVRKLQLGASTHLLPGWLNTDLCATRPGLVYLDVTRPFPLPDSGFDYVFSEQMIEHISYEQGQFMMRECLRVLKPGGTLRVSTPDLSISLQLYGEPQDGELRAYQNWFIRRELPHLAGNPNGGVFILNMGFRAWGHQFLYDRATLSEALVQSGFGQLKFFSPSESDDPELRGIETHGRENGTTRWDDIEAFVLEAKKP